MAASPLQSLRERGASTAGLGPLAGALRNASDGYQPKKADKLDFLAYLESRIVSLEKGSGPLHGRSPL